jgi:hypothetical protein
MNDQIKAPIITIKGNVDQRNITGKTGLTKTIYSQKASLEMEQMRIDIDVEVDGPNLGYRIGEQFVWDVTADLQPGQYGRPELARKKTLRPFVLEAMKPARAAA